MKKFSKNTEKKPLDKKARLIKILVICVIALISLWVVSLLLEKTAKNADEPYGSTAKQKDEKYNTVTAYEADWDKNVYEDEDYMLLSTDVFYSVGENGSGYTFEIIEDSAHEGHRFFESYFKMLKEGEYSSYPGLFHEDYESKDGFEKNINRRFPPQMVYDIKVSELGRFQSTDGGKACIRGVYLVDYKIYKNDCLFRNDIGYKVELESYVSRPLIFELVTYNSGSANEKTYIFNQYTASSIQ